MEIYGATWSHVEAADGTYVYPMTPENGVPILTQEGLLTEFRLMSGITNTFD